MWDGDHALVLWMSTPWPACIPSAFSSTMPAARCKSKSQLLVHSTEHSLQLIYMRQQAKRAAPLERTALDNLSSACYAHGRPCNCSKEFVSLHGPAVLLFDDVHHVDTASWRLLAAVAGAAAGALFVAVAMRPPQPKASIGAEAAESMAACIRQCKQVHLTRVR